MGGREFSCIKQVVTTVQIPLPATFISNEISGIAEILESWKRQYKKQLQGVVVNYRQYSLSSPYGFIAPNKPFVYYNVKATFDLFCPNIGDIVKGKINRISKEHVGCLIEETINVTIHLSKDSPQELAPFISLNREILFEISYFNYDRKMIRVTGKITPKCIQLMKDLFPSVTFNNLIHTPELSNNTDEGIGTSSESTDDGLLDHNFNESKDENFKKPFSSNTKSKKNSSKRHKNDSESPTGDTLYALTSFEKSKKKKHKDKSNLSSDSVSCEALIQNFSSFNHSEILETLKEEVLSFDDTTSLKKHKKKKKQDLSLTEDSAQSSNQSFDKDTSNFVLDTSAVKETGKLSKKRKRESESSFVDTSEQSTADEMPKKKKKRKDKTLPILEEKIKEEFVELPIDIVPTEQSITDEMSKKKKKHKDKTVSLLEKEIKNELLDIPVDDVHSGMLSIKKDISSPVKTVTKTDAESKKKKKNKDKKSRDKNKDKKSKNNIKSKKKGKILASGAVLKKDKKSHKKSSKKNKLEREQSKKHKKPKSDKKDKSEKKKDDSKSNVSDVIKSEKD